MHEAVTGAVLDGIQLVSQEQPPFPAPLHTSGVDTGNHEYEVSQPPTVFTQFSPSTVVSGLRQKPPDPPVGEHSSMSMHVRPCVRPEPGAGSKKPGGQASQRMVPAPPARHTAGGDSEQPPLLRWHGLFDQHVQPSPVKPPGQALHL